jgi:hypothetical protein
MSDETTTRVDAGSNETTGTTGERVGFCQDCGKPLNRETVRTVGSGVFCEPCLETRLGATQTASGAGYRSSYGAVPPTGTYAASGTGYPAGAVPPQAAPMSGEPSPALAGWLGLIPGVGAMYNGQYAKGVAHLVIFVVLATLQKDVSDVCGLLVAAWVVYQSMDAYHTAKARRDGLPLPNAFSLNDIGDRMGFGKNWPGSASRPVATAPPAAQAPPVQQPGDPAAWGQPMTPPAPAAPYAAPAQPGYAAVNYGAPQQAGYAVPPANWAGYVPPHAFAGAPPATPYAPSTPEATAEAIKAQAMRDAGYGPVGYAPAYAGTVAPPNYPTAPLVPTPKVSRFPMGAVWLIALGVLVLADTVTPSGWISGQWILAAIMVGLAVWIFTRCVGYLGGSSAVHADNAAQLVCTLRAPVILLTLAVLFALQAAHVATLGQTWGVLVIVFGAMLLAERTIGSGPAHVYGAGYVPPSGYGVPPAGYAAPAADASAAQAADDAAKGGQR